MAAALVGSVQLIGVQPWPTAGRGEPTAALTVRVGPNGDATDPVCTADMTALPGESVQVLCRRPLAGAWVSVWKKEGPMGFCNLHVSG